MSNSRRTTTRSSLSPDRSRPNAPLGEARALEPRTLVDRVRGILQSRNLTLYRAASVTRLRHPREPAYRLPPNLYFQLRSSRWTPAIHQLSALSQLSGYRLADWMRLFGFRLDDISSLEAILSRPRTALLDPKVYDPESMVPWFEDRPAHGPIPPVAPLSQLLAPLGLHKLSSIVGESSGQFIYAKIGEKDAFAFPDLLPGSIVRATPRLVTHGLRELRRKQQEPIFLVEYGGGYCCTRLHLAAANRITLVPTALPFSKVELQLGSEARILGVLDREFRSLCRARGSAKSHCIQPEVARELSRVWSPGPLGQNRFAARAARFLRDARLRAGLSLERASEMSRHIGEALGDPRYFASPASLSDYEASGDPPRHIHKLLTLSILYAVPFWDFLNSFGISLDQGDSIPAEWLSPGKVPAPESRSEAASPRSADRGFLSHLLDRFEELPFFLRDSLGPLAGMPELSLQDIFWAGGEPRALHPALSGVLFAIVNRRRTRPLAFRRRSLWDEPLYVLIRRNGSYSLANCTLEDKTLVVHPYSNEFVPEETLRLGVDAEVVGQIVAIARSLPSPESK
jgi:transcriptional regulator with XRE-family HTH domain